MKTIYRPFQQPDLPALIPLMEQLGYRHSETTLLNNIQAVQKADGEIFVVETSGQIEGCISAIIDVRLAEGKMGEIVSLVVSEEARGLGLGKGLVSTAENWLFQRCDCIRVRANQMRDDAHKFYQNMGYEITKNQVILIKKATL